MFAFKDVSNDAKNAVSLGVRVKTGKVIAKEALNILKAQKSLPFMVAHFLDKEYSPAIMAIVLHLALKTVISSTSSFNTDKLEILNDCISDYAGVALVDLIPIEDILEKLVAKLPKTLIDNDNDNDDDDTVKVRKVSKK